MIGDCARHAGRWEATSSAAVCSQTAAHLASGESPSARQPAIGLNRGSVRSNHVMNATLSPSSLSGRGVKVSRQPLIRPFRSAQRIAMSRGAREGWKGVGGGEQNNDRQRKVRCGERRNGGEGERQEGGVDCEAEWRGKKEGKVRG